jgi:hypothetical protein
MDLSGHKLIRLLERVGVGAIRLMALPLTLWTPYVRIPIEICMGVLICVGFTLTDHVTVFRYSFNPDQLVAGIAFIASIVALDIAVQHVFHLRGVRQLENDIRKLVQNLLRALGLEQYVGEAAKIYATGSERVVTSLRHWVCAGKCAEVLEPGIEKAAASSIVFAGTIRWDAHFIGVMWRFAKLWKYIGSVPFQNRRVKTVSVQHVEDDIPTFVVSRKGVAGDGELLVGISVSVEDTTIYGTRSGDDSPCLVRYYNFLADTLICPTAETKTRLQSLGVDLPMETRDGLAEIFGFKQFQAALNHRVTTDDGQATLLDAISANIAGQMKKALAKARGEDVAFLEQDQLKVQTICREFLDSLMNADILECFEPSTGLIGVRPRRPFDFNGHRPQCDNMFKNDQIASPNPFQNVVKTEGTETEGRK